MRRSSVPDKLSFHVLLSCFHNCILDLYIFLSIKGLQHPLPYTSAASHYPMLAFRQLCPFCIRISPSSKCNPFFERHLSVPFCHSSTLRHEPPNSVNNADPFPPAPNPFTPIPPLHPVPSPPSFIVAFELFVRIRIQS